MSSKRIKSCSNLVAALVAVGASIVAVNSTLGDDGGAIQTAWAKHFPGQIVSPLIKDNLLKMLDLDPACAEADLMLWNLVDQYGKAAYLSRASQASEIFDQMKELRSKSENSMCSDDLNRVYLLASVAIHPYDYGPWSTWARASSDEHYDLDDVSPIRSLPMIAAALLNNSQIEFLDSAKRSQLGGSWNKKISDGYWIDGAFDCNSGVVFIDPDQRPLDLAGTFLHELLHLYRDRKIYGVMSSYSESAFLQQYLLPSGQVNWDLINLADENAAIVSAALWQMRLTQTQAILDVLNPPRDYEGLGDLLRKLLPKHPNFQMADDLTLFSKGGALETLESTDLTSGDWRWLALFERHQQRETDSILLTITQKYFPDMSEKDQATLVSQSIYYPEYDHSFVGEPLSDYISPDLGAYLIKSSPGAIPLVTEPFAWKKNWNGPYFDLNRVLVLIDSLSGADTGPSDVCTQYEADIDAGKVSSYVGLGLEIKPSEKGTKPGEKGTKPAEKGSKPSEKGTKPSIHPCITLRPGI